MFSKYLVKQTTSYNGDVVTHYIGRQDAIFTTLSRNAIDNYSVKKYGYNTLPAAKRSNTYRNRSGFIYDVLDVQIIKINFNEFGSMQTCEIVE